MAQGRKSSLGNRNATTSPFSDAKNPAQEASEAAERPRQASEAPVGPEAATNTSQDTTAAPKGKKKKVSFYQHPEEEARARAAWMHTMGHTGHTTITSFMEAAVANYTRQLEAEHNDSRPFN